MRGRRRLRARHDQPRRHARRRRRPTTSSSRFATTSGPATRPARASIRSSCSQFPLLEEALGRARRRRLADGRVRGRRCAGGGARRWRRADAAVERVLICTPDKDLAQCVRGTRVVQLNRRTRRDRRRGRRRREVRRAARRRSPTTWRWSATPPTAIPGLPGWGAKSAAAVLARFGHLEAIPDDWRDVAGERREPGGAGATLARERELALLFRDLATLRTDSPLFDSVDELRWNGPDAGVSPRSASDSTPRSSLPIHDDGSGTPAQTRGRRGAQ